MRTHTALPHTFASNTIPIREDTVISYPGLSQYGGVGGRRQPGAGATACGIAAVNCAKTLLTLHATGIEHREFMDIIGRRATFEVCEHTTLLLH